MVTELKDGTRLPELLVDDYIGLAEEAWKYRHEAAARTVADSGLKPEDRLRALDQLDQMRGTRGPLVLWGFTYTGAKRIVEASLRRGGVPADCIARASPDELMEAALSLIGVKEVADRGEAETEADPKTAPAT